MTRKELAQQAFEECCNPDNAIRPGKRGERQFWNDEARQFMYVPALRFPRVPNCNRYRYDAMDEQGVKYSFEADNSCALLTPIWRELPEGVVRLTVTAVNPDGTDYGLTGARIFFKVAPFPEVTPEKKCSYMECASKAYEFGMQAGFVQHWLHEGTPDPYYELNTYPSKMIRAVVEAMLSYARLCPEKKEDALKICVNAADYLMKITPRGEHPLANIPPTYELDFCPDAEGYGIHNANYDNALAHFGTVMMIYPAYAGRMYLQLYDAVGDKKYFEEALKIGKYYLDNVQKSGSWYLVLDANTGEPKAENLIAPMENVVPFLMMLYDKTGDEKWKKLCDGAVDYAIKNQLSGWNWEGQFEDVGATMAYFDLSQYGPADMAMYFAKYRKDDPKYIEIAKELMRFCEDQFVVWNRVAPWYGEIKDTLEVPEDYPHWSSPACYEQYLCYAPIDASAAHIIRAFLSLYDAGCGEIYLAKARVLADQITRAQYDNGKIPTFWEHTNFAEMNFWFNCMFSSCNVLETMSRYENIKIE